ncbi:MAG: cysteine desulfurase [Gammaproteobacteria bacterium]|nr:cysteine desulfurase [Gammaproteobacteria bacterium]
MNKIDKVPLYFDTAATTQIAPEVLSAMVAQLGNNESFANPSSAVHLPGQIASSLIEGAREQVAAELRCESDEVVFTSGATEANNLALRGIALANADQGRHLITSKIEHKAVLSCCESLEREGFEITYVSPNKQGWIEPSDIESAIRPDTLLVSLMHTNNETGVMQPVDEVATMAYERGVLFHVDAAQAAGKFSINLNESPVDLLSLSAHKFHGPKGIGCLVIRDRRRLRIRPLVYGGGQEFGLRSGTVPTHQVIGLAAALKLAAESRESALAQVKGLKAHFLSRITSVLPVTVHGDVRSASPYIVNLSIAGIGSACGEEFISVVATRKSAASPGR